VAAPNDSLPILLFPTAAEFEQWIEANHDVSAGLWLKISKKGTGISSTTYAEALDIALCFGWIDGQRRSFDDEHFLQRFTPRRKSSIWSKRNVEKIAALTAAGLMRPSGIAQVEAAKADGRWDRAYASQRTIEVPADFQAALDENVAAKEFFESLSKSNRFAFLFRIETAKRAETRARRITQFVNMLADHKVL
jgi:uncharacterized protein YdeI (YjbR/CyaY-like superfamily)